ncbi:MAG: hypothetical protein Q8L21_01625, partial [Candidatus Komeilibacteria bacterium]|nr:hypothetical protein [Candidatus Komeilibacteria bacterium]
MPPDKNQNINLLPDDLERKRAVIKQVISQAPKEYTNPPKLTPLPTRPKYNYTDVKKEAVVSAPKPNLLTAQTAVIKPVAKTKPKTEPATHWWTKFFSRPLAPKKPIETVVKPITKAPEPIKSVTPLMPEKKLPPVTAIAPATPTPPPVASSAPQKVSSAKESVAAVPASGENFGVNLLSQEYAAAFKPQNQKVFFAWSAGITILLIILAYVGIYLYQAQNTRSVAAVEKANAELEQAITSFGDLDKEDQILGRKVVAVESLLSSHISWRSFLEKLEGITIPEVTYLAMAASNSGAVTITARAVDYTALGRQITVFQESAPWLKEV